ncbi:molybdopterin molybdotransferase MoeA [Plectonema cf. radiosum LEGE 06105]|uniref:Molybdopterin molybdenumtransferase n=1 Tax=Plectonema cf. radiosum LEGE 06105 TaxID=945769 RepID=A0A8J7EZ70_9CYAN|nr:gephyrin-like molybdotransferase Glp [Plectonema radiosum]MBE9212608.1 molybdopterin molybdotransferase MoeA [Plectonema cf. radiosum LEGE 06105]
MLSVKEAENIIFNLAKPLNNQQDIETVDLFTATGRILASPVTSKLDFPHWDNSAMDGYAVIYQDVKQASEEKPAVLKLVEDIPAGYQPQSNIQSGQAARIFTGAVMPKGADTVVMQENTRREANQVFILAAPKPQEFVRYRGAYYQAGTELLPAGIKLNPPEIAILAASQCTKLNVYRRPRVAILSTGNELVTPDEKLQVGQIVDSNQYALAALVKQSGGEPLMLGIIKDEPEALKQAISQAISKADLVLSSGGVSVGDYDYVEQILASLEGEIKVRAVAMQPGKPLTVATFPISNSPIYFGLPGNPVSALVSYLRFVQPVIKKLSGIVEGWKPTFIKAQIRQNLSSNGKRETYIWGKLNLVDGVYQFSVAGGNKSSGNLIDLAQTNAFAVLEVGKLSVNVGEEIWVLQV